jgi:hypothetical protein
VLQTLTGGTQLFQRQISQLQARYSRSPCKAESIISWGPVIPDHHLVWFGRIDHSIWRREPCPCVRAAGGQDRVIDVEAKGSYSFGDSERDGSGLG